MGDFIRSLETGLRLDAIPVLPEILPWNLLSVVNILSTHQCETQFANQNSTQTESEFIAFTLATVSLQALNVTSTLLGISQKFFHFFHFHADRATENHS